MNKFSLSFATTAAALIGSAAFAGGLAPTMAETAIVEETAASGSSAGMIIPLILIALILVAMSASTGGSATGSIRGSEGDDVIN